MDYNKVQEIDYIIKNCTTIENISESVNKLNNYLLLLYKRMRRTNKKIMSNLTEEELQTQYIYHHMLSVRTTVIQNAIEVLLWRLKNECSQSN